MVGDADGVPRQAGVLPRVVGSDVFQSENLHVLVSRVHTCSLYSEDKKKIKNSSNLHFQHLSADKQTVETVRNLIKTPELNIYCSISGLVQL